MNGFELFTVEVTKANRYVHKIKSMKMHDFDLKSAHVSCLYYLYVMGNLTAKELCKICEEDKSNISRTLEYLEKNGYLTANQKGKRYNTPLALTEKGTKIGKKITEKIDAVLLLASDGITEEERKIFYETFIKINENLEKIIKLGEENEKEGKNSY